MDNQNKKWIYLLILSIIWGSSFILIKKSLIGLNALQVGALRIFFTTFFLFIVGFNTLKTIKGKQWRWIALSGILGSGIPPFLFAIAQTEIDSAVSSVLNSLTPLNTVIIGIILFGMVVTKKQILGVIIGLAGSLLLIISGVQFNPEQDYWFSLLIILATVFYAMNVNIIKKHLGNVGALAISTGNFAFLVLPALVLLWLTGFFEAVFTSKEIQESLVYVIILSLFGTAFAMVLFNKLIQIASPVFASSVTYIMTLVAVFWGVLDGEQLGVYQLAGGAVILLGVYLSKKG